VRECYEARAGEYDDWWQGNGLFSQRERPGWFEEVLAVASVVTSLPAARTLDVACGTGFLTKFLHGAVTGLNQSESMLVPLADGPTRHDTVGDEWVRLYEPLGGIARREDSHRSARRFVGERTDHQQLSR
jgi:SAM-dependent methyltransferase